jgi:hypothetical protein
LAWFTLKGAENRAFNWIENPRVGGSNPPSGTIFSGQVTIRGMVIRKNLKRQRE